MKTVVLGFLAFVSINCGISTAAGGLMNDLRISGTDASPSGVITLQLNNVGSGTVKIWRDSNSWGAARWRVFLIRNGVLEVFFQNPDQHFTRNGPVFDEIRAEAHVEQKLDLNGENWCGMGHCTSYNQRRANGERISLQAGDIIAISYDVPVTDDAKQLKVWYGVCGAVIQIK